MRQLSFFACIAIVASIDAQAQGQVCADEVELSNSDWSDKQGWSVALSADGTTAVAGAPWGSLAGSNRGVVHVYRDQGSQWNSVAQLQIQNGDNGDNLGYAVDVSDDGNVIVAGAIGVSSPTQDVTGGVAIFEFTGNTWQQKQLLVPPAADQDWEMRFGMRVATSADGTVVAVGAVWDDNENGKTAGSVYVYRREGGAWSLDTRLIAPDGAETDHFGYVALSPSGGTLLSGASRHANALGELTGALYVYRHVQGVWTLEDKLIPPSAGGSDAFGYASDISADETTIAVSAEFSNAAAPLGGAVYVYEFDGAWKETALLAPDTLNFYDVFGRDVAISGDGNHILAGAFFSDEMGNGSGSAYRFRREGTWTRTEHLLASDGSDQDQFGSGVALSADGSVALIGAPEDDDNGSNAGSIYLYSCGDGPLAANTYAIPSAGGSISFSIDAGVENAGRSYALLGSITGTSPGTPLPGGHTVLPLNWDAITDITLSAGLPGFSGTLDQNGRASATLVAPALPPGSPSALLHFAYTLIDFFNYVSPAVSVQVGD